MTAHRSYKSEYSDSDLSQMKLRKSKPSKTRPACPVCHSNEYVRPHYYGYIIETLVPQADHSETLGAPYSPVYDGYDMDCPRCMVIFASPQIAA